MALEDYTEDTNWLNSKIALIYVRNNDEFKLKFDYFTDAIIAWTVDTNLSENNTTIDQVLCKKCESDTGKSSLLRQLAMSLVYGDSDFLGFKLDESSRNVIYVSTEDGQMATSVWMNKYFGEEVAKDERLSKLKYVFDTEGIFKNLRQVVRKNKVDLIS